jgi:hypothetical protein
LPPNDRLAYLQRDVGCAPGTCWRQVPVEPPLPLRVAGFLLPPPGLDTDVALVCCVFPEYTNVAARSELFSPGQPRRLGLAGAGLLVFPERPPRKLQARPYASWRQHPGARPRPRQATRGGGAIRVQHNGRAGHVVVLEQYFPGWQVRTGNRWQEVEPTPEGLLQTPVARGQLDVRFRFTESRPGRAGGWAVSGAALLAATVLTARNRRRAAGRRRARS